jgi:hypothetical protein
MCRTVSVPKAPLFDTSCTLSCHVVDSAAVRYFFNDVPQEVREAIRAHFAGCRRCRTKLQVLETVWTHLIEEQRTSPGRGKELI